MTKKMLDLEKKFALIEANHKKELEEYSESVIIVPAEEKWDYAIPENYSNYHDGFLYQDDSYKAMPLVVFEGKTLYLHRALDWSERKDGEDEKYLLFDRKGRKYTFIVKEMEDLTAPNPSYYRFLPKVKRYERRKRGK